MHTRRRRILFLAEGITMTHFARPAALASALDSAEWEIFLWTPKRFHALLEGAAVGLGDLRTLEPAAFLNALAIGAVAYSREILFQDV
jgi:UDP:flavonoid glycosyltransferase YjiC (YdhE family)